MRRSSLGKTLAGLTLALVALEAVSQSKDEALASIGDNSDEPSGWMRLEVAIFVDTSDETLASELWEVDPELGYPTNRRWLTDYAEIKALMDEWGEEAVNIDTNGAIAVVPSPPPQPDPDPDLNPETATSSETDTETTAESEKTCPVIDQPSYWDLAMMTRRPQLKTLVQLTPCITDRQRPRLKAMATRRKPPTPV